MRRYSITEFVLADTNILIAAHQVSHPAHPRAAHLIGQAILGERHIALASQNFTEWFAVVTNPRRLPDPLSDKKARQVLTDYLASPLWIVVPTRETLGIFLKIIGLIQLRSRRTYDIFLAATALTHGITTIYTENIKDFRDIPGITAINPLV